MAAIIAARNQERSRIQAVENAKMNENFIRDVLSKHNISQSGRLEFEEVRSWLTKLAETYARKLPKARANSLTDGLFPGSVEGMKVLSFTGRKANNAANQVPDILLEQGPERPPQEESHSTESADNTSSDSNPPSQSAPQNEPASRPPSTTKVATSDKSWIVGDDEVEWVITLAMTPEERASLARIPHDKKCGLLNLRPADFEKSLRAWLSYINNKDELQELMARYKVDNRGRLSREHLVELLTDLNEGQTPDKREIDWVLSQSQGVRASAIGFVTTPGLIKVGQIFTSCFFTFIARLPSLMSPWPI